MDINSLLVGDVCNEFLVPSFGVWDISRYKRNVEQWPQVEQIDNSITPNYYTSKIWGGYPSKMKSYLRDINDQVDEGLERFYSSSLPTLDDIVNRALHKTPPALILSPFYMYPEPPTDLQMTTEFPSIWLAEDRTRRISDIKIQLTIGLPSEKNAESHGGTITRQDVVREVTAIIPHFNRKKCLHRLLVSLATHYAGIRVVVIDSSREANSDYYLQGNRYLTVLRTKPDIGLSAMRNMGARLVTTPYALFLDDDFVLASETKLENMLDVLVKADLDGVGGQLTEREDNEPLDSFKAIWEMKYSNGWLFEKRGTTLKQYDAVDFKETPKTPLRNAKSKAVIPNCYRAEMVENALLIRTDSFHRDGGLFWDDTMKMGEHEDFFLSGKNLGRRFAFCHGDGFFFRNDHGAHCATKQSWEVYTKDRNRQMMQWAFLFRKYKIDRLETPASNYTLTCGGYKQSINDPTCFVRPEDQWDIWYQNELVPEDAPFRQKDKNVNLASESSKGNHAKMVFGMGSFVEVKLHRHSHFLLKGAFTVDFWLYPTSKTQGSVITSYDMSKYDGHFRIMFYGKNLMVFRNTKESTDPYKPIIQSIEMNHYTWHHIVVSYDTRQVYVFVDGELSGSVSSGPSLCKESIPLCIGCNWSREVHSTKGDFVGTISEMRLWKSPKTKSMEAIKLMETKIGDLENERDLLVALDFQQIRRGVIRDASGGDAMARHHGKFVVSTTQLPSSQGSKLSQIDQ